jgi:hypothetical protein
MCSIHIDKFVIHVTAVAWPSRLCVPFSEKLDILLVCLDNRRTIHDFQCDAHEDGNDVCYCNATTLPGYKYFLRLALLTISHFFISRLGFSFLLLFLATMEDKRGTKCSHPPSKEGSSSPSSGSTPPSVLSGSPLPPRSLLEISSRHSCSLVFEQGGPSEKVLVVDLSSSSDELGLIPDALRDEEFARRLFVDLNCDVLGPPRDIKVIVLSDSDEEEEVREEDAADAEVAPSSVVKSSTLTASADNTNDTDKGRSPDRAIGGSSSSGDGMTTTGKCYPYPLVSRRLEPI